MIAVATIALFLAIQSWAIYWMLRIHAEELNLALDKIEAALRTPTYIHQEIPDDSYYGASPEERQLLDTQEGIDIDKLFPSEYNDDLELTTR